MKKTTFALGFASILTLANAAIVIEETFDYPDTPLSSTDTGGVGFDGGYYADDALSTSPSTLNIAGTTWIGSGKLTGPFDISLTNMGTTDGEAHRALGSGAFSNNPASAETLYMSFTYRSDGSTGGARIGFGRGANETLEFRQFGGGGPVGFLWSQAGGNTLGDSVQSANVGSLWMFVVARFDFGSAGNDDRIQFNIYTDGSTIADNNTWSFDSGFFTMQGGTLDQFYKSAGGSNTRFGNIRVGESFMDVTGVPEPSTYALLAGFATLGLVLMRRRLRS